MIKILNFPKIKNIILQNSLQNQFFFYFLFKFFSIFFLQSGLVNNMCGNGVQRTPVSEASKKVWTSGCIEIIRAWAERNLYTIAGIALGVALSQLFVIYLAKTLEGQIELQKSRWHSWAWPQATYRSYQMSSSNHHRQVAGSSARARRGQGAGINARMALLVLFAISLYVLCILLLIRLVMYFKNYFQSYIVKI